jgi:hypothetical protein
MGLPEERKLDHDKTGTNHYSDHRENNSISYPDDDSVSNDYDGGINTVGHLNRRLVRACFALHRTRLLV